MNSLVLITAMTATSGLFGKHCGQPKHHAKKVVASCYSSAPCGSSYATPYGSPQVMTTAMPQAMPAAPAKMTPTSSVPPAPVVPPAPPAPPTPSPSSALDPANQPAVATGGNR